MRYATEGIHYYNDEELDLLRQRTSAYFDTRVDVQQSVAANGDRSTRAQQLLLRLSQNADVHDDHIMMECSANTLHVVVDWMCNDQDIDMTKRERGGSYDTAAFKKFVRSQARENEMLKTGIVDFMKSGGKDKNLIHEAFHEVTEDAIAAAEVVDVECVKDRTLDLVSGDLVPRGNIFEAVEELTAALTDVDRRRKRKQGWEIVVREHNSARTHTRDITVQDVGGAVSLPDVTTVLKNPVADARTVHGGFREWRLASIRPSGDFNEGGEQPSWQGDYAVVRSDDKGDAQIRLQQENPTLRDLEEQMGTKVRREPPKQYWMPSRARCYFEKLFTRRMSLITRNNTDLLAVAGDVTTRRGKRSKTTRMRTTEENNPGRESVADVTMESNREKTIPRKEDHVERSEVEMQKLDKGATHTEKSPEATMTEAEETTERTAANCRIMTTEAMLERWEHLSRKDPWYNRMYLYATRGTIRSADLGHSESCGKTRQGKKGENTSSSADGLKVVDESNIYLFTWKGRREEIRLGETDVMCLAVGKWLNDNVMDMYLQSVYEEQCQGKDTAKVHVCTTFWNPQLLANQQGDTSKRGWELRVKSQTTKVHRQCKNLEVAPVVLIPINHKHHWMLLILLNLREFWTDGTWPNAIIVGSCHGYASPDWKALRTLLWHEYLNDNRRGPDVTRQLVDKSWNTCGDVFGRGLIHARYEDLASSLLQVRERQPPARQSKHTAVRKEKRKIERRPQGKSKTSPLMKSRADRAAVTKPQKAKQSEGNKRQRDSAPTSPASVKNRTRHNRSPPRAPRKTSCAKGVEDQPRRNIENPKRRRIIDGVGEEKEAIDLRGSDGVEAGDTEKPDVSQDAVRKTQQSDPHDNTEGGGGRSEGTCNEGESYAEDTSNEEENSDSGSYNNEDGDDDDEEEEDRSRSSGTEERCSEDNTQNTSRRTYGGTSDGRSEENNADKQLVLKEKANEGRWGKHVEKKGLRNVLIECNRMMTTVHGELSWHLRHWFWAERGVPLVRGAQTDHNNTMRNELRCQMSKDKTWRRKDEEPWGASHFKRALTKVFQIRKDGEKVGVTLQQLAFTKLVIRTEIEQTKKLSKASDQLLQMASIKNDIVNTARSRDTVMSFCIFKLDTDTHVADVATRYYRAGNTRRDMRAVDNNSDNAQDFEFEVLVPHTQSRASC
ncbi:hypothetical protein CBR_g18987 [Chara braunii]|uniref:Ubiquitin-like protease family profile domain-containing protein n=1 Tax=Chara braunii TaxID=69332 RepID=A0A388KX39_CHABU|nr:hypothetical protein CBR_g18987 [Chara braunii]|eukprot:GBG74578.1 hypothetical protein CBR_g18987 [Chara braunii]